MANELPFEVKLDEPNQTTYQAIDKAEKDEAIHGPFNSVSDMMRELQTDKQK
ncbi:hypothetical protein [uncultured Megasphaera sp.]|uniref:hypothetical protein n=1 Tax=uncultured Megasphaera sp. TaxID=165188 RepID=UPI00265AFECF|nr:hypothetical protein [uncultured Megasphaera sp.]